MLRYEGLEELTKEVCTGAEPTNNSCLQFLRKISSWLLWDAVSVAYKCTHSITENKYSQDSRRKLFKSLPPPQHLFIRFPQWLSGWSCFDSSKEMLWKTTVTEHTIFKFNSLFFFLVQISPFAPHPSIFTAVDCVKWPHFDKSFSQLRFRASYYLIFFFLSSQIMSFVDFSFLLLFLTWRTLIMFLTSVCFSLLAPLVAF